MKKGICFIMTAALGVMLLTACGDSRQSGNANERNQSESSTVQSSEPETENQEGTAGDDTQPEQADATGDRQEAENNSSEQAAGKVLVVYYSASGNTKAVAETIAAYTEGDTFEIIPVEEYTSEDLNWSQERSRVNLEHEDESLQDIALVSTTVEDFDSYDSVFIG